MSTRMDRHNQEPEEEVITEKRQSANKQPRNKIEKSPKPPKPRKPKKRGGFFKKLLMILLVLLLLLAGFSYFSYRNGLKKAKNDKDVPKMELVDFKGDKSTNGSTNILLLGSDSRGTDQGRSDTLMIAHYSKNSKTPKLMSIMRDTYVNIPGYGYNKINAAYSYGGAELVKETIKENFDISIQYYAIVNFQSFPKIIDTLLPGGVEIDAEKDLDLDGVFIKKGPQKMDGNTALQYSRFRKDDESDFGRVRRQQQMMTAVMQQSVSLTSVFTLPKTIGQVQGYTQTDIPNSFFMKVGTDFVTGRTKPLEKLSIPVEGTWWDSYVDGAGSVLEIDEAANRTAIKNFLN